MESGELRMENGELRIENINKRIIKSVRNLFLAYLFISLISDRPGIFAAICASFPFIIPVIFMSGKKTADFLPAKSFIYGVPGILVAVLYLLLFGEYSTFVWLVPASVAFSMCILYTFVRKRLKADKLITARAVIVVAVCFISFI